MPAHKIAQTLSRPHLHPAFKKIAHGTSNLQKAFSAFLPELVRRIDEKMVFKPLSPETQREIGQLTISEELARFRQQGFELIVSEPAFEFLVRRGIHKVLGARAMKRTVQ